MVLAYHHTLRTYGNGTRGEGGGQVAFEMLLRYGGGALIGAGLFTPFKRPWTGAIIAFVVQVVLWIFLFFVSMFLFFK